MPVLELLLVWQGLCIGGAKETPGTNRRATPQARPLGRALRVVALVCGVVFSLSSLCILCIKRSSGVCIKKGELALPWAVGGFSLYSGSSRVCIS